MYYVSLFNNFNIITRMHILKIKWTIKSRHQEIHIECEITRKEQTKTQKYIQRMEKEDKENKSIVTQDAMEINI